VHLRSRWPRISAPSRASASAGAAPTTAADASEQRQGGIDSERAQVDVLAGQAKELIAMIGW